MASGEVQPHSLTLDIVYRNDTIPRMNKAEPAKSNPLPLSCTLSLGSRNNPAMQAIMPIGTLIQKMAGQPKRSTRIPPMPGPAKNYNKC